MEIQETYNNLKRSRTFITEYADLDSRTWHLQFNAQHYNGKNYSILLDWPPLF